MSNDAISWAWQQRVTGTQKLVLLCLADWADADDETWPKIETIAQRCGVEPRTIQLALRVLEDERLVIRTTRMRDGRGGQTSNLYTLPLDGVNEASPRGANEASPPTKDTKGVDTKQGKNSSKDDQESPVVQVWAYYVEVFGATRQSLNGTRRRIIAAALKVRSIDECKRAIDGLRVSPYHNGQNEQQQTYLDIRYALRGNSQRGESNEERIDKMAALAPSKPGHPSATDATIARLIEEVRYTVETNGERERGKRAWARLMEMGFKLTRLDGAPWVRAEAP